MSDGCTNCGNKGGCDTRKHEMFGAVDEALARLYPTRRWDERDEAAGFGAGLGAGEGDALAAAAAARLHAATLYRPGGPEETCDYVYMHDLVKGVEDLRTTLETGLRIEKEIRGATAGFNTPTVVVDAPGGGGKRDAHSYEHYDRTTGVSVYTAPAVHPGVIYFYFDPIDLLPPEGQARWADPAEHDKMIEEARAAALATPHP